MQNLKIENDNITFVVILYNMKITDSPVINMFKNSNEYIYIVDNSTDSTIVEFNKNNINLKFQNYISFGENKGLSYAYNRALETVGNFEWICFLDQDTEITESFFEVAKKSILENNNILVHAPIIHSQRGRMSPLQFKGHRITTYNKLPQIVSNAACINSGTIINKKVFEEIGNYDEKIFLDQVDYDFFKRYSYQENNEVKILNYEMKQNFSGDSISTYEKDKFRFEIFKKDYKYFCKKHKINFISMNKNLLKRNIKLIFLHGRILW